MFLEDLTKALSAHNVSFAIVGGYAVALHGAVRGTVDIDFVLNWELTQLQAAESALTALGLHSRIPITAKDIFEFRDEYIKNRNLIAWNFYHPKHLDQEVDIIITFDLTGKSVEKKVFNQTIIPYLNKDDLILMKKVAGRDQDLADIDALRRLP